MIYPSDINFKQLIMDYLHIQVSLSPFEEGGGDKEREQPFISPCIFPL